MLAFLFISALTCTAFSPEVWQIYTLKLLANFQWSVPGVTAETWRGQAAMVTSTEAVALEHLTYWRGYEDGWSVCKVVWVFNYSVCAFKIFWKAL